MNVDLESSRFTRYTLSDEERQLAVALNSLTVAFLRNEQALIAEQKLNLTAPKHPDELLDFVAQEAFLAGQLAFVAFLLDARSAAYEAVKTQTDED